ASTFTSIGTPRPLGFTCRWQVSWLADLRVCAPSRLSPVASCACAFRLQLRGQPRSWPLMGNPHRVPFSAASESFRTPHHHLFSCHKAPPSTTASLLGNSLYVITLHSASENFAQGGSP